MSKNKTSILIAIAIFFTLSCHVIADENYDIEFDPFSSSDNDVGKTLDQTAPNTNSGPLIPQVEFTNNDISMVFQIISDATGWSIFPTQQAARAKVSLWAKNVTAHELLEKAVTMAELTYHQKDNMITVMTYDEYMQYYGLEKRVFNIKYGNALSLNNVIKPFMTKMGKVVVYGETNSIVLYEVKANLDFISAVIEKLDTPSENRLIEVIDLKYADSQNLATILQSVFSLRNDNPQNKSERITDSTKTAKPTAINLPESSIIIEPAINTNQLLIAGTKSDIDKIKDLIKKIDVAGNNMVLEVVKLDYADSELIAEKLNQLFSDQKETAKNPLHKSINPDTASQPKTNTTNMDIINPQSQIYIQAVARTNQLIIKGYKSDTEKIRTLITKLDHFIEPVTYNYQLTYINAADIYDGLNRIFNLQTTSRSSNNKDSKNHGLVLIEKTNSILLTAPPSAQRIMSSIINEIDKPAAYESGSIRIYKLENADVDEAAKTISELLQRDPQETSNTNNVNFSKNKTVTTSQNTEKNLSESEEYIPQIQARVSVSKSTNSIVVQATSREHRELEKLIKELDTRRKQVLVEAKIIEVTSTDNLNIGAEISHAADDFISFSSFGLSTNLDPSSGTRNITISPGGTASVLTPGKMQTILQFLKQQGNVKITSAPMILVNDNSVGFINNIAEEPTTQTNQGETTTTTSFSGFVEAGTEFAITPHISENDYLRIEYQITLNSFGTKPTDPSIPPPRNTSSIQSEATVPDGFTIIVGGLQTTDETENVDKVPFLGDIPIIEWFFKNTRIEKQYKTTYLFITPRIMKSDDFSDLKEISTDALSKSEQENLIGQGNDRKK